MNPKPGIKWKPRYEESPRGYLTVEFEGRTRVIIGGPFGAYKNDGIGVCLEIKADNIDDADFVLDVRDFTAPKARDLESAIAGLLTLMHDEPEQIVFVGCRGGIGRTGTFIAALVRVLADFDTPINAELAVLSLRERYYSGAVETGDQMRVIEELDVKRVWSDHLGTLNKRTERSRPLIAGVVQPLANTPRPALRHRIKHHAKKLYRRLFTAK